MKKIKVGYVDIKHLLDTMPSGMKIPLSGGDLINLIPDQILNEINEKTEIGKKYYLQLAKIVYKRKFEKTWRTNNNGF